MTRIEHLMSTALITMHERDLVTAADTEMKLGGMRHIPVVDEHQNLVGMLSAKDVLLALSTGKKTVRVGEYMSRDPVTVTANTSIREAIDLLLEHRIGSLPVLGSDGALIGIVTETDFLRMSRDYLGPGQAGSGHSR